MFAYFLRKVSGTAVLMAPLVLTVLGLPVPASGQG